MSGGPQVFLGATTFCVTCRQISGCREEHLLVPVCLVCPWAAARPLAVRAASFARRVVSKPGQAPQASRRPPIGRCVCVLPGRAPPPPTGTAVWPSSGPCDTTPIPATMSGLGHSRINKSSTTCVHAQWCNACPCGGVRIRGWACWCGRCTRSVGIAPVLNGCSAT